MKYICPECGSEIEDGADFCYNCGCLKSKAYAVRDAGAEGNICSKCGEEVSEGELFCRHCGAPVAAAATPLKVSSNSSLALLLAFVPGFFSIYGLGHLVLKEWIRASMFLSMTALYWYMRMSYNNSWVLMLLSIGLFIYQTVDIFRLIVLRSMGHE